MHNGWTGGQYSLYRILFGLYLSGEFLVFIARDPLLTPVAAVGILSCVAFVVGWRDRGAAVLIFGSGVALLVLSSTTPDASRIFVGWLLFAHAMLPAAPYGSLSAVGRADPKGGWYMSRPVYLGTWALMALWYGYTGFSMLVYPGWLGGSAIEDYIYYRASHFTPWSETVLSTWEPWLLAWLTRFIFVAHLSFAPLALIRRFRPWLWAGFAAMHLLAIVLLGSYGFSVRLLLLHAFTFDPGWIRPRGPRSPDTVFFDGNCGLCHRAVRFLVAEDASLRFRYTPLDTDVFRSTVPERRRRELPDSVVLLTDDDRLLVRSDAVLHVAARLGGVWRVLGSIGGLVPRPMRDGLYDFVSRHRGGTFRFIR